MRRSYTFIDENPYLWHREDERRPRWLLLSLLSVAGLICLGWCALESWRLWQLESHGIEVSARIHGCEMPHAWEWAGLRRATLITGYRVPGGWTYRVEMPTLARSCRVGRAGHGRSIELLVHRDHPERAMPVPLIERRKLMVTGAGLAAVLLLAGGGTGLIVTVRRQILGAA